MNTSHLNINRKDNTIIVSITDLGIASKQTNGSWTIFCPSLKILGYSNKNKTTAFKDFEENLTAFFDVHLNGNSLERALLKFKWEKDSAISLFAPILANSKPKYAISNEPALKTKDFELSIAA